MSTPNYCTRTPKPRNCTACSLVNYGLDCANNPLPRKPAKSSKWERALAQYNGHKGEATIAHVERNIESVYPTAYRDLTGVQYGRLMSVANTSYHAGRASTHAERIDPDAVYVDGVGGLVRAADGRWDMDTPAK